MGSLIENQITDIVTDYVNTDPGSTGLLLNGTSGLFTDVDVFSSKVLSDFEDKYGQGLDGYLQNIVETSNGNLDGVINAFSNKSVPEADKKIIKAAIQSGDYTTAANTMSKYSDEDVDVINLAFSQLKTTISGTVVIDASSNILSTPYEIGSNFSNWETGDSFDYISSFEELIAEFRIITREVTTMIVHWSDSFTNKHLNAEQIHDIHQALGMSGIGYHFVIRRDGTLQRGRPVNVVGDHTTSNNNLSLGVVMVGGYNCPTGTETPELYQSVESLTRAQFNTLDKIIEVFYQTFPGGQVLGHNDVEPTQIDPGFDVPNYCRNRFGKGTLYEKGGSTSNLTTAQINRWYRPNINNVVEYELDL